MEGTQQVLQHSHPLLEGSSREVLTEEAKARLPQGNLDVHLLQPKSPKNSLSNSLCGLSVTDLSLTWLYSHLYIVFCFPLQP